MSTEDSVQGQGVDVFADEEGIGGGIDEGGKDVDMVDISALLSGVYGAGNEEWVMWRFSDEEQARRKAYLPKP